MRVIYCSGSCSRWVGISCGRVDAHGAELEDLEMPLADAHPLLPEKHRPGRVQLDGNSQKQQQPRKAQDAAGDSKISSSRLIRFRYTNVPSVLVCFKYRFQYNSMGCLFQFDSARKDGIFSFLCRHDGFVAKTCRFCLLFSGRACRKIKVQKGF